MKSGFAETVETVRRAAALLDPAMRRTWLALVPLAVLAAVLEALAAALVFGLIRLVTDPAAGGTAALAPVRRLFAEWTDAGFVALYGVVVVVFFVVKNALRLGESFARQRCASTSAVAVSTRLLRGYLAAPYALHLRRNSAELIRNTHASVDQVCRTVLTSATAAVSEGLVVLGLLGVLVVAVPGTTVVAGTLAAGATVVLLRAMQAAYAGWGRLNHELNETLLRRLQEIFRGIKEIKILGREDVFAGLFAEPRAALGRVQTRSATLEVVPRLAVETLFIAGVVAVIALAVLRGGESGSLLAALGLIAYALMRLLPSVHLIVYNLNNCRFGAAAVDEVYRDWPALSAAPAPEPGATLGFRDSVTFENVAFEYPQSGRTALHDVNLGIRRGESIGIVGPTGAGKSTLVDLFLGLLAPTRGRVLVDGADLQAAPGAWHARIGYVSQHAFFIDDTLGRNVALGTPDADIDAARLRDALRTAQLEDFVAALPDGLDTVVGEAGVRLSGGERQRLAIARALYRAPEVLVFDEATSALDNATERALARAIGALRGTRTIVVIAHRLATVRTCDRLVFLQDGAVADVGPFDALSARNADFRAMIGSFGTAG